MRLPQGTTTAYSLTTDVHQEFTKSFVEHGFIIGVMVARYDHTYQQGLERFWSRKDRFDFLLAFFANIGEQAVLIIRRFTPLARIRIMRSSLNTRKRGLIIGISPLVCLVRCAAMRRRRLINWHLADDYDALPTLSDSWIREEPNNVNRVLAVTSEVSNQLFSVICIFRNRNYPADACL